MDLKHQSFAVRVALVIHPLVITKECRPDLTVPAAAFNDWQFLANAYDRLGQHWRLRDATGRNIIGRKRADPTVPNTHVTVFFFARSHNHVWHHAVRPLAA